MTDKVPHFSFMRPGVPAPLHPEGVHLPGLRCVLYGTAATGRDHWGQAVLRKPRRKKTAVHLIKTFIFS